MRRHILLSLVVLVLSAPTARATLNYQWAHRYAANDDRRFEEIAFDPFGSIVGIGAFYEEIILDQYYTTTGYQDVFIVKYAPAGNILWSKHIGYVRPDDGYDITTDPVGNVIACGYVSPVINDGDGFLAKYAPDGTQRFFKTYGAGDGKSQVVQAVATDVSKSIIVAGQFEGDINFGGGTLNAGAGQAIFLAKLDQLGNQIWAKRFTTTSSLGEMVASLKTAPDGSIFVYGMIDGTINFGTGALTSAGDEDLFLARFDPNGNAMWAHSYGDSHTQFAGAMAVNESGRVAITGGSWGKFTLGGDSLFVYSAPEIFTGAMTPAGTHLWSFQFPGPDYQIGTAISWASNQDILLVARGAGSIDFGGGLMNAGGVFQLFVGRFYGVTGLHRWSWLIASSLGGMEGQIDEYNGKVVLSGSALGSVNFGGGLLPGNEILDAYVAYFGDVLTGVSPTVLRATLQQNVPNPFNPQTTITYTLADPARAVVAIYDAVGALVARLDQSVQPAGTHSVQWDGRDRNGKTVASGVYFYRLEDMPESAARKMVLLK